SMKQYKRALWAAQHAFRLHPDDPRNRFGLAASELEWAIQSSRMGLHSERIAAAQQELTRLLPDWPDKAGIHFLMGRAYTALDKFEQAARLAPRNPLFQERLGRAYLQANDLAKARPAFETAIRLDPNRSFAYQQLAVLYVRLGDKTRAAKIAQAAKEMEFNE